MEENMEQNWLMCDMHTHSHYSALRKSGDKGKVKNMAAKDFVDTLYNYGVKVFSLTDHNYFAYEYYKEIEEYISSTKLDIRIINGAELDCYVDEAKRKFIHCCFYFSSEVDKEKLHSAINELYICGNAELKPTLSEILDKLYNLGAKFIIIPHGDKSKRGIFEYLRKKNIDTVPEFYKYAMYKIFGAFDVTPNFYESGIKHWALGFFNETVYFEKYISDISDDDIDKLKSRLVLKIKQPDFVLNDEEQKIYDYAINYGGYFAYFSFSDWHNVSEYKPEINNFIFGSLELPFESFEMSVLDPGSRIINSKDKEIKISSSILKEISFEIDGKKKSISFSPGLNAIVGKRGSGKSLLLSIIKNLSDKDSQEGVCKKYNKLNVTNIEAKNRDDIEISLGSLNSISFLSQDNINAIFENPEKAVETIVGNFKELGDFDKRKLNIISDICDKLKPINKNYKNITSNISGYISSETFSYSEYKISNDNKFDSYIQDIFDDYKKLIKVVESFKLDTVELENDLNNLIKTLKNYKHLISMSKNLSQCLNDEINFTLLISSFKH